MLTDRLITVAIHTYDRAHRLKSILESEGISVVLQNVNLTNPSISAGVRVRIKECDLPLALRIIENIEIISPEALNGLSASNAAVLVPVDFSECSMRAAMAAFELAKLHGSAVHLLHSYIDPAYTQQTLELTDSLTFEPEMVDGVEEVEEEKAVAHIAHSQMEKFADTLREKIKDGVIPGVKFTTSVTEGLPEEAINEFVDTHKTLIVVMGTLGAGNRHRELVGSVTAEVLDAAKATVLTVTPAMSAPSLSALQNVVFFAAGKQDDILALDALSRILPDMQLNITLVQLPAGRFSAPAEGAMTRLCDYCRLHYPSYHFSLSHLSPQSPVDDFEEIEKAHPVDLIVVGNRHKNIFARLFNPSWAHRLLFRADTPLLSIPLNS